MPHMVGTGAWLRMQPFQPLWAEATLPVGVGSTVIAAPRSSLVLLKNVPGSQVATFLRLLSSCQGSGPLAGKRAG